MTEEQKAGSKLLAQFEGIEIIHKPESERNDEFWETKGGRFRSYESEDDLYSSMKYHTDYNELMRVWRSFRDLEFDLFDLNNRVEFAKSDKHAGHLLRIKIAFMYKDTPEEAFKELVDAVTWYTSLKPKD